ncbi:MAG: hypothetical protein ACRDP7_28840 [Trebonia sp.]
MSQETARQRPDARSAEEDVTVPRARRPEREPGVRPRQPVGRPDGDGGVDPDEPDEGEFELIGDNDLGAADLGPLGPNAEDPDADSGRIRKITPDSGRGTLRR